MRIVIASMLLLAGSLPMSASASEVGAAPPVVERLLDGEDLSALVATHAAVKQLQPQDSDLSSHARIAEMLAEVEGQSDRAQREVELRRMSDAIEAHQLLQDGRFEADARLLATRQGASVLGARLEASRVRARAASDGVLRLLGEVALGRASTQTLRNALDDLHANVAPPVLGTGLLPNHRPRLAPGEPATGPPLVPSYARSDAADPEAADRSPDRDAPFTAEVMATASALGYDAARIFDRVRGQIETQWYAGTMKSPDEVLRTGAGNDVDQARLLVALLRASGFGARYVRGVVRAPASDLARQLGVREGKVEHALRAAGIAARPLVSGGALAAFEFEQTWVAAFIPFAAYRGAAVDRSSPVWVPLMPALKPYAFTPALGVMDAAGIAVTPWIEEHLSTPRSDAPLERLRSALNQYAAQVNPPATLESFASRHVNSAGVLGLIPGATSHPIVRVLSERSRLDQAQYQTVLIELRTAEQTTAMTMRLPVEQLAGRRVTLAFIPATADDQDAANAYGGISATPAYLIRVRPIVHVDGRPVGAGDAALEIGRPLELRVEFSAPAGGGRITQQVISGGYAALVLAVQDDLFDVPSDSRTTPGDSEPAAARLLAGLGARYLQQWNRADREFGQWIGVTPMRPLPSAVLVLGLYRPQGTGGVVERLQFDGVGLDAGFRPVEPIAQRDGGFLESDFLRLSALHASALEHRVFESQWGVESISADKALAAASALQRRRLTGGGSAAGLAHPAAVRGAIQAWLDQGYVVDTTQEPIQLAAWRGSVWRAQDLSSGESGWFITGVLAGGSTATPPALWTFRDLAQALANPYAEDPNTDPLAGVVVSIDASAQDQRAPAGEPIARPLLALVRDADGRPVTNARVTFEVIAGDGKLDGAAGPVLALTTTTDRFGIARVQARAPERFNTLTVSELDLQAGEFPQRLGVALIDVRVDSTLGVLRAGEPYSIIGTPGEPARVELLREGSQGIFPAIGGRSLRAEVRDRFENPISNRSVAFSVADSVATDHPDIAPSKLYIEGTCGDEPVRNSTSSTCGSVSRSAVTTPYGARILMLPSNLAANIITVTGQVGGLSGSVTWNSASAVGNATGYAVNQFAWLDYRGDGLSGRYAIDAAAPGEPFPLPRRVAVVRLQTRSIPGSRIVVTAEPFAGGELSVAPEGAVAGPIAPLGGGMHQYTLTAGAEPGRVRGRLRFRVTSPEPPVPNFDSYFDLTGATVVDLAPPTLDPEVVTISAFGRTESEFWALLALEPADSYVGAPLRIDLRRNGELSASRLNQYAANGAGVLVARGQELTADDEVTLVATINEGTPYVLQSPPARLRFDQDVIAGFGILTGPDLVGAPSFESLIVGRYPENIFLKTDVDAPSRTVCVTDTRLGFALAREARVTIEFFSIDPAGDPAPFPTWTALASELRGEGPHLIPVSVMDLPFGTYKYTIKAVATGDGRTDLRTGRAQHRESRNDSLPLAHSYVKGVDVYNGNAIVSAQDFDLGGIGPSVSLSRTYASHGGDELGVFGRGWDSGVESEIKVTSCNIRIVTGGAGQGQRFIFDRTEGDGTMWFRPLGGYNGSLTFKDGNYVFYAKDGTRYHYGEDWVGRRLLSWTQDTNGNRTTLEYASRGRFRYVVAMRDDDERAALFEYALRTFRRSIAGAVVTEIQPVVVGVQLPDALVIRYDYDPHGNLISVVWPNGVRADAYEYDDLGGMLTPVPGGEPRYHHFGYRLTVARNARNNAERNYAYALGIVQIVTPEGVLPIPEQRVETLEEPDGGETRFTYIGTRGLGAVETTVRDTRNITTHYALNIYGAVETLTDPAGITRTEWDFLRWQPRQIEDANGRIVSYTYDDFGNRLSERTAFGGETIEQRWTYYPPPAFASPGIKNRESTHANGRGIVTNYAYDSRGNRTGETRGGITLNWTWGPRGTRDSHTTGAGERWNYGWDSYGFPRLETRPMGGITQWTYDARGRKREEIDPNGGVTNWEYDVRDRVVATLHPATGGTRARESVVYNDVTDTVTRTNARNFDFVQRFDSMGRPVREQQATGEAREIVYDLNGNKTSEQDFRGNATTFEYDNANRLTKRTEPLSRVTEYTYDAVGNVLSEQVSAAGSDLRRTEYLYRHPLYRRTQSRRELAAEWLTTRAGFDPNGNQILAVDPLGRETVFVFDPRDRLQRETRPLGRIIETGYDGADRRIEETQFNPAASGNQVRRWSWDADGRLKTQTDAEGKISSFDYDPKGNRIVATNPRQAVRRWAYDARDRVIEENGPVPGQRWLYRYDPNGNRQFETIPSVPQANEVEHVYDPLDRRERTTDSLGLVEEIEYNATGQVESRTNANGHVTTFTVDPLGRPTAERRPMGRNWGRTWTIHGELETETDPRGFMTVHTYDGVGRKLTTQLPPRSGGGVSEALSWTYDAVGNVLTATSARGFTTTSTWDELDRKKTETSPPAEGVTYQRLWSYDTMGNALTETDRRGIISRFTYDRENRRETSTRDGTLLERNAYDAAGNIERRTDALGTVTRTTFDLSDRPQSQVVGEGSTVAGTTTWTYTPLGDVATVTDPMSRTTTNTWDQRRRMVESINEEAESTEFDHDGLGQITQIVTPMGYTSTRIYDDADRLEKVSNGLGKAWTYSYNGTDQRTAILDPQGRTTAFDYDSRGLLASMTYPSGVVTTFRYDADGHRERESTPNGVTITHQTDALGRRRSSSYSTVAAGEVVSSGYSYDGNGNLLAAVDQRDGGTTLTISREYDNRDRIVEETDPHGRILRYTYDAVGNRKTRIDTATGAVTMYTYDARHRNTSVSEAASGTTAMDYFPDDRLRRIERPGSVVSTYDYDGAGRIESITHSKDAVELARLNYDYDLNGNRTKERLQHHDSGVWITDYTYDAADRLKTTSVGGLLTSYTLDDVGNRRRELVTREGQPTISDRTCTFDNRDRMKACTNSVGTLSETYDWDDNGNLTVETLPGITRTQTWDARNRLLRIAPASGTPIDYTYDPEGQRIESRQGANGTRAQYDAGHRYAETNGAGQVTRHYQTAAPHRATARGGWARAGAAAMTLFLGMTDAGATPTPRHYLHDALSTPIAITTHDGAIAQRSVYDAWGNPTTQETPDAGLISNPNRIGFTGYVLDREGSSDAQGNAAGATGAVANARYYAKARYYNAGRGSFLSTDPWSGDQTNPLSYNKYLYAYANPGAYVDPDGRLGMSREAALAYARSLLPPEKQAEWDRQSAAMLARLNAEDSGDIAGAVEWVAEGAVDTVELGRDTLAAGVEEKTGGLVDFGGRRAMQERGTALANFLSNDPLGAIRDRTVQIESQADALAAAGRHEEAQKLRIKGSLDIASLGAGGYGLVRAGISGVARVTKPWRGSGESSPITIGEGDNAEISSVPTGPEGDGVAPSDPVAANLVTWVDEGGNLREGGNPGMRQDAYEFQSRASGARSNLVSGRSQAPYLEFVDESGALVGAKFDGVSGNELIDRKINPVFSAKAVDQARRQSAVASHFRLTAVWEMKTPSAVSAAERFMKTNEIEGISVRLAPE
jgi:RHS repeat-associated protein